MKKTEINITKSFSKEHKKLLFFAPIGIVAIVIMVYVFTTKDSHVQAQDNNKNHNTDWTLPKDSKASMPNEELEVYDQYQRNQQKLNSANSRDFFSDLNNYSSQQEKDSAMYKKLQAQLESIEQQNSPKPIISNRSYNQTQRTPVYNGSGGGGANPQNTTTQNQNPFNDFFTTNPQTPSGPQTTAFTQSDIQAVIHQDYQVKNGDRIKIRLIEDAVIGGEEFSKNQIIYGFVRVQQNRVGVTINKINTTNVNLSVYDKEDGNLGIHLQGANVTGEISQEVEEDALNDLNVNGVPIGNTIKKVFQRKNREQKVFLWSNYQIILKTS